MVSLIISGLNIFFVSFAKLQIPFFPIFMFLGMSLKEEFEYLSFRCCYCSAFNPARKKRPTGPKFETGASPLKALPSTASDSDRNSASDSDADSTKPLITEPRGDSPDVRKLSDVEKLSDAELNDLGDGERVLNVTELDEEISPMEISEPIEKEFPEEAQKISESENETRF